MSARFGREFGTSRLLFALLLAGLMGLLTPSLASAESSFNGNSCTSAESCFAVGATGQPGSAQILIEKWNGSAWSRSSYTNPSGAVSSRLNAVSCRSATSCLAVGSYVDSEGDTNPLALSWNGSSWTQTSNSPPQPSGSTDAELLAVTCPTGTTSCRTGGSYTDSGGKEWALASLWGGGPWTESSLPMPEGATGGEITGASCGTASACNMVGSYLDGSGTRKPLAFKLNGSAWLLKATPLPAEISSGRLEAISCWFTTCVGVGSYVSGSANTVFALSFKSDTWYLTNAPAPGGAKASQLAGVSCVSTTACTAVGGFDLNTRTQPFALVWDGTNWSEGGLDGEPLGADDAALESASCPSSTVCQAVGSLTYRENGPGRAFAYGLTGGKWAPSGADGFQRQWALAELPPGIMHKAAEKADISCFSSSFCMRVGAVVTESLAQPWIAKAKTWNGTAWTATALPNPAGAGTHELSGVACPSSTVCRAVGTYLSGGVKRPYSLYWSGSSWSVQTMPTPVSATSTQVSTIACVSASDCRAVGSYVASGVTKNFSMAWNGTAWSVTTTPVPSGAKSSELSGIACTAASACRAVGSYVDSGGVTKTLAMAWNGTSWSITSSPNPSEAKESKLTDLSCVSATFCMAVGKTVNSKSETEPLAQKWTSALALYNFKSEFSPPLPGGVELDGVACASIYDCKAVGQYPESSGESKTIQDITLAWQNPGGIWEYWQEESLSNPPGALGTQGASIACPAALSCVSVGTVDFNGGIREEMARTYQSGSWSLSDPLSTSESLSGVDCASSAFCLSVGRKQVGSTSEHRAWKRVGKAWSKTGLPAMSNSRLYDVDCTDASNCTAVGSQTSGTSAVRWNGSSWAAQTTANPAGGYSTMLTAVSCPTTKSCTAVGRYAVTGVPITFFAETWDGTSWSMQYPPVPAGSTESWLEDISCPSPEYCMAVGVYKDGAGNHGFAHRWNGKTWRIYNIPAASDPLLGVSCTSSTNCIAVGRNGSSSYAARWNGISWATLPSPNISGASWNIPVDVSCPSSAKCLAAGQAETAKGRIPFLMGWDGNAWSLESAPAVPNSTNTQMENVACPTTLECVSVGLGALVGRSWEVVLESSESSIEAPDTSITAGASGKVGPNVSFSFAATESSAGFECSLDAGAYAPCSSPKSYSALADGAHTFKVRATDLGGNQDATPAERAFTVGQPPETTITSETPTYTEKETWPVTFTADEAGSTFQCSFDGGAYTTCTSPHTLPTLSAGWHTFAVRATDKAGETDPTAAVWAFNHGVYPAAPETSKLISPTMGQKSSSYFTLRAQWGAAPEGGGVTGVRFQIKRLGVAWETLPPEFVKNSTGGPVTWPLKVAANPGETESVFFNAAAFHKEWGSLTEPIKFRAVFDGGPKAAGVSPPANSEFDPQWGSPTDAREQVGPATLNLLTGGFTLQRTDVSIPVPGTTANLEFSRVFDSQYMGQAGTSKILGGNWQPSVPVERGNEGEAWQRVVVQHEDGYEAVYDEETGELIRPAIPPADWAEVITNGEEAAEFRLVGGNYVSPSYAPELKLQKEGETFVLTSSSGGKTVFTKNTVGAPNEYRVTSVSTQANAKAARMVYSVANGAEYRLSMIIAPSAQGVTCDDSIGSPFYAPKTPGCRSLTFEYTISPKHYVYDRLHSITYYNATGTSPGEVVARYGYTTDIYGTDQLTETWDPRVSPSLKEKYSYEGQNLKTLTPSGEEPYTFAYYNHTYTFDKLKSVSRASLVAEEPIATNTIVYNVPLSGSGAPYDMSPSTLAGWGQTDYPVNATAIFPASEVPSSPPSSYADATIKYMDPGGHVVNTATPQVPGASGPSIEATETDLHGNVVRILSPQARLTALEAVNPTERSRELDTKRKYSVDGAELQEEWGPLHEVRLESGITVEARAHKALKYDEGAPSELVSKNKPHLVTTSVTGALIEGQATSVEQRVEKTEYDWTLLKPTASIVDPSGLNLRTTFVYSETGMLKERRLPANPAGGDARTTRTIYYTAEANKEDAECGGNPAWANLACKTMPAAQPTPAEGNPGLPITKYAAYSALDLPTEIQETTGGVLQRTTKKTYDAVGRVLTRKIVGGGQSIPKTETIYSPTTGKPVIEQFVCEAPESCAGFDSQATTITYNAIGQQVAYEDADGNKSATAYDLLGRPVILSDGKGTQVFNYEGVSELATELTDSAAGTFTAGYNADGNIVTEGLPNGLTALMTYDETGTATHMRYEKTANCVSSCTWLKFGVEESIHGQWLRDTRNAAAREYSYDKAGRLLLVKDRPLGTDCTTRTYTYDADSNRTKLTTRAPGAGGACDTTSAGATQSYTYDTADRLIGGGVTYDNLGRITSLPSAYAGGGALSSTFYTSNLIRSQTQDGLTNTYMLDATLRQRAIIQSGTKSSTAIFHYSGPADGVSWVDMGTSWTRNIGGLGGGLAAVEDSTGSVSLQLEDLHGDIAATASLDPYATGPVSEFKFDEFGLPKQSGGPRYGWLGGKGRRTELSSGVVQMGVRSYVPAMGRFISPDPITGGSANAYDYAYADPVNVFDLTGEAASSSYGCAEGHGGVCTCKNKLGMRNVGKRRMRATFGFDCKRLGGGVHIHKRTISFEIKRKQPNCVAAGLGCDRFQPIKVNIVGAQYQADKPRECGPACKAAWSYSQDFICSPGRQYQIHFTVNFTTLGRGGGNERSADTRTRLTCQ